MAVLLSQDLPLRREDLSAVTAALGAQENPPEGLLLHALTELPGGGVRVVDVWESPDLYEKFLTERLLPTMGKVFAERGIPLDGPMPEPELAEVHDLITARR
ncbi:hypothetical protein [Jatrophihabitans sp.]|uniref:hypothetical protein n=1 Tax=Jatrophihabitans sp. TaxID=1932789 RepID=UPI002BB2F10C|nr:hypothetical protein [Jatrophihabitans sp.]